MPSEDPRQTPASPPACAGLAPDLEPTEQEDRSGVSPGLGQARPSDFWLKLDGAVFSLGRWHLSSRHASKPTKHLCKMFQKEKRKWGQLQLSERAAALGDACRSPQGAQACLLL